jgi:16S rRNA (cytosine967-C5)-methyltransferase
MAAEPKPGYDVLDVCSAPGGKSFASAIMMNNTGRIISCDIHEKKLNLVSSGAKRLGIDIIKTLPHDGRESFDELSMNFDLVITDVPCSGIGVIRTKPDIRYKEPTALERLPEIQLGILRNASKYVKIGGTLLYSTCTILKRENEGVIAEFLKDNDGFELSSFTLPEPFGNFNGMATILPYTINTDGFFICKLRRKK